MSDVKIFKGSISEAHYENITGENTQTTNESAIRYLLQKFPLDKIFIFASKKVRSEINGYSANDGKPITHLKFSIERFKKFLPGDKYYTFDYDEDGSDNDNLKSIAEMARLIQNFAADEEVTLHVDLTGGMRHVNMMMLELTRLLEYSGMTVGKILYSNYRRDLPCTVEEIQNVYDLFQLIAGVEEFVNFGSVKALNIYYANRNISDSLQKLCDAMKNFAEAIKLCHYGQFKKAIENLHDAVHDFDKHESENVEDILMARLIGRIRENYHDLIANRNKDDLQIIRWCLDNDYLQQALTLYTERIPEYLGEKGIITQTEDESKKLSELVGKDKMRRNYWFYLFSDFNTNDDILFKGKSSYIKAVKSAVQTIIKDKTFDFDGWLKELNQELSPLNLTATDTKKLRSQFETIVKIFNEPQLLLDLSSAELNPIREIIDNLSTEFKTKEKGFERKRILKSFFSNKLYAEDVLKYFFIGGFVKLMSEYPNAIKIYELLVEKTFSLGMDKEIFLSIADKYYRIKDERNHTAHAREDYGEFTTADELRNFMIDALNDIQNNLPKQ